ncbi:MAG: dihydrofolate reductase family protein [Thermoleophilaceae bacterium]|nr:dihydrofolate reductase family protein [Thermoleophilaceae bacterium]
MSKIIWHITMSVDGFIAGPDDSMDWAFRASEPSALADEIREGTGAILGGRRWYDAAASKYDGVAGIYGGGWSGPVFVLTHRPEDIPEDPTVTFLSEGLRDAVGTARDAAAGKNVEIFGANTAQQCLDAGPLDEIAVHLAPVLLGDGVRLYGAPAMARQIDLERTDASESGQVTDLRFRVRK